MNKTAAFLGVCGLKYFLSRTRKNSGKSIICTGLYHKEVSIKQFPCVLQVFTYKILPCVPGLDMCETTIQDMKWMRRANWQNNPTSHLSRSTSIDLTEQLEEKVRV